jgi:flagellar biosynthesis protein FlhG
VGKTSVSLSLAVTLARMKKQVLLLDADLGLANVHIMLGTAPRLNLSHLLRGECTVEQIITKGPEGISLLPGASGIEEMANLDSGRIEYLGSVLARLEQQYDYVVIDTAAGIGTAVTHFVLQSDLPLIVLTPEPTSLADAYSMVKVLYEHGAQRVAVLVNMAGSDRDAAETFDRLNTLVVRFLQKGIIFYGALPFDHEVSRSVRRQRVFVLEDPSSRFAEKIQGVARKISGMPASPGEGFFSRLWRRRVHDRESLHVIRKETV